MEEGRGVELSKEISYLSLIFKVHLTIYTPSTSCTPVNVCVCVCVILLYVYCVHACAGGIM